MIAGGTVLLSIGATTDLGQWFEVTVHANRRMATMPILALGLGALLLVAGTWFYRVAPRPIAPRGTKAELGRELQARPLPFSVCLACHTFTPPNRSGMCIECGACVDCLEVTSETDRRTALTALGA